MPARLTVDGGLATLVLDQPRANLLDRAMIAGIREAVEELLHVPSLRLLAFTGAGGDFCFGASVAEHRRDEAPAMLAELHAMFREIEALGVPTAAAVRGRCLGAGLELAAWTGRLVAAPDATLGCPEVRLGVFPPMGVVALGWRVGGSRAIELAITGRTVGGEDALATGLVDQVHADPMHVLREWFAEALSPLSAAAVRHAWRAARLEPAERMARLLPRLESLYLDELMLTHDANEGIAAFTERRPPRWTDA